MHINQSFQLSTSWWLTEVSCCGFFHLKLFFLSFWLLFFFCVFFFTIWVKFSAPALFHTILLSYLNTTFTVNIWTERHEQTIYYPKSVLSEIFWLSMSLLFFILILVMLNKLCHAHYLLSANQITSPKLLIQIHILNGKQCRLLHLSSWYKFTYQMANSADPDQLASSEANWSGSTLFAKLGIFGFSRTSVKT